MGLDTKIRVGADVGGTFTDVVLLDSEGNISTFKVPSSPPHFEQAVLDSIGGALAARDTPGFAISDVAHGTTVATNAVLEQRGARTALITTRGFRDVLELRRVRAPQMYDLFFDKPESLVERRFCFELSERMSAQGEVLSPIDKAELSELKSVLEEEGIESVAVCLLHAYAFPEHEVQVGKYLREQLPDVPISLSAEVLPEKREYERTATTVVNAYVRPIMREYLKAMRTGLRKMGTEAPLLMMQSAGGLTPESDAAFRPVFVLESGPAAGVLAAKHMAKRVGVGNLITFDMGGTTAKASMIESGQVSYSPEYEVGASMSGGNRLVGGGGDLIRAPSIDIAEVGSGGGSIARLDRAGGLRVGPRSAGAIPGPVCYQMGGTEPTVTDANVVLGYIRPGRLADGTISIDSESARRVIQNRIAAPLGIDLLTAAEGVHRIANARSMRALRAVSTERGRDARDFALIAFGGSGPVHAAGLARELLIRKTIIPPLPGLFSSLGLLFSGIEHHDVRSCLLSGPALTTETLGEIQQELSEKMLARFQKEGFSAHRVDLESSVDIRFQGQASEIRLPWSGDRFSGNGIGSLREAFLREHEQLYGHRSDPDNPIEALAVRLIGRGGQPDQHGSLKPARRLEETQTSRPAYFGGTSGTIETPVVRRSDILGLVSGPLLIDEYDSTIVVPPGCTARVDDNENVILEPANV